MTDKDKEQVEKWLKEKNVKTLPPGQTLFGDKKWKFVPETRAKKKVKK